MGTIQNSLNNMLGTAAAAAAAGKHIQQQKETNEIAAASGYAETMENIDKLEGEQADLEMKKMTTEGQLKKAQEEAENQTPTERLLNEINGTGPATLEKDLFYQEQSLKQVDAKLNALYMQRDRFKKILRIKGEE
jgi:hypothetical protein